MKSIYNYNIYFKGIHLPAYHVPSQVESPEQIITLSFCISYLLSEFLPRSGSEWQQTQTACGPLYWKGMKKAAAATRPLSPTHWNKSQHDPNVASFLLILKKKKVIYSHPKYENEEGFQAVKLKYQASCSWAGWIWDSLSVSTNHHRCTSTAQFEEICA